MPITSHHNYSLTFGILAGVIPASKQSYGALNLTTADIAQIKSDLFGLALDHGVSAAARRIIENGVNVTASESEDSFHQITTRTWAGTDIEITQTDKTPHHPAEFRHNFITITFKGNNVYDSGTKHITGGEWMPKLNLIANSLPLYKYESVSAQRVYGFQKRTSGPKAEPA